MADPLATGSLLKTLFLQPPIAPATSSRECAVGPDTSERIDGAPSWGSNPRNTQSSFAKAVSTFLASGCVVIEDVLPKEFARVCKAKAVADISFLRGHLETRREEARHDQHLAAAVQRVDFRELVQRDGGRFDVRFQLDQGCMVAGGLIYNPIVFPLVQELLGGGEVNLLYAGVMWAESSPSSKPQKWHGDGGHLFHHAHQPPHCINVFYPLVDLKTENGPTEFKPGTHLLGNHRKEDSSAPSFGLCCEMGGAVLFDYRVKHRGGANTSLEPRPVLYLAYAKPWFRDAGNLRSSRSLVKDATLSPPWVARILTGQPMRMGQGFVVQNGPDLLLGLGLESTTPMTTEQGPEPGEGLEMNGQQGSGERWVLFQMDVDVGTGEALTITVHHGDVAIEVSSQFCHSHGIDEQFVPVLAETIQQQIDASTTNADTQQNNNKNTTNAGGVGVASACVE